MVIETKVHESYRDKLKELLKLLGWGIDDWTEFSGILEVVPLSAVKNALRGRSVRENYVYSIEWCIDDLEKQLNDGELVGKLGITRLDWVEFRVKVRDNQVIFEFAEKGSHAHLLDKMKKALDMLNI